MQSCMVYEKQGISLEEAQDKGRVKVVNHNGQEFKFKNILYKDSLFYGQKSNSSELIKIYTDSIEEVYLFDEKKSKLKTILFFAALAGLHYIILLIIIVSLLFSAWGWS